MTGKSILPTLFAVKSTVNSSIKMTPFEADLGYIPLNPLLFAVEKLGNVRVSRCGAAFHERQAYILLRCRDALAKTQENMRNIYHRNREEQVFDVGDRVYLSTKHLDRKHTGFPNSTKLGPKWMGPHTVVRKVHNHAYELNTRAGNKLRPRFTTGSLQPYKEPNRLSRPTNAVLVDGSVGQLVKQLLGKRRRKQSTQFLWSGRAKRNLRGSLWKTWDKLQI
ncbi:hypothetical protein PC116_g10972 [Phytophthora cactorum]|nr:hypothetical protein Pcac1_g10625 [Phytophthora cactorum]KAG2900945.1 hypothetical protein PC114_g13384 [Phytophthora cactorum]KAG3038136.1 hypothetical protein PC119_g3085 [Phytophthora cactorum]KAG3197010.1 hypothetical protein PC128_g7178 [Phytophthora cactorum]KAG4241115.1 hypothetical protein PC116_g10972 [Phytophthora cactorum]